MLKSSQLKVNNYWNNIINDPDIDGVCPMGGGGLIEIYYREYFEKRNFLKFFNKKIKPSLLEIGCGSGRWAVALNKHLKNYSGIDISRVSINKAVEVCKSKNINNCDFYTASVAEFNSDQKFDIIYLGGVTQYMENNEFNESILYLKKFLKPNGIFIDRSTITLEKTTKMINKNNYFAVYRTEDEITNIFKNAGLKKIHSQNSYRFLRIGKLARFINYPLILNILKKTPLITYNILYAITCFADLLKPKIFYEEGIGNFTHKFQIFK